VKKLFFLLLSVFLLVPPVASAQNNGGASAPAAPQSEAVKIMPVPPEKPLNLFGQNHYYTVTFRGNGEAVVTFKAILSNTSATPLSTVSLRLPENVTPTDIIAYQVIAEPWCMRYVPRLLPAVQSESKMLLDPSMLYKEDCAEYQQPNYEYISGNTKYQSIQNETKNNTLLLQLPTPIEPNKSGSYFVYYRTGTLTNKNLFGAYDYTFETLKTEDKIHTLQVGISTDSDYILRGAQTDVNYAASGTTMAALPADSMERSGVSNPQFDQFYNQIGSGVITKQVSDLASIETYTVKGLYADSQIKLYGNEVITAVLVILLITVLIIVIAKITLKKLSRKKIDKPEEAVVQLKNQNKTFLIAVSISFVSMLLICLYTFGIYAITQLLNPNMYYGYSNNNMIFTMFVFAVSALVYLFCFFAPSIGMGVKKGWGWALVTFSATVVWAVLFLLVLFALFFFFTPKNDSYPKPYPMMMEGRAAPAVDVALPAPAETTVPASEPQIIEARPVESTTVESGPVRLDMVETITPNKQ
jgi:heme/copper-type cytochrome/quinol oxidase subunit 2